MNPSELFCFKDTKTFAESLFFSASSRGCSLAIMIIIIIITIIMGFGCVCDFWHPWNGVNQPPKETVRGAGHSQGSTESMPLGNSKDP